MDEKGLGKRLQEARQAAGLTQQSLCHKAGLSYSTLAKIERGAIKAPSIFTIQQLTAVLGLPLDALLGTASVNGPASNKRQSKSGVRFVYFDVNGCLVRFFQRAFTQLAQDSGASADTIESTFWHYNEAVCRGELSLREFNEILAKQFKMPHVSWSDYYFGAINPIPETQELVHWAADHYNVGLLTNIMPGFIDIMQDQGLLPKAHFSAIVDSSKVGAVKPEPKIYEIAEKAAGVTPDQILLVDDDRPNLMAAERAGWHVLWFDDYRPAESAERVRKALEF